MSETEETRADGPKWRRRAEARPDDILDAAEACFLSEGYARATIERIARGAGLSKGAVYLYFESKEAMLLALIRRSAGQVAAAILARLSAGAAGGDDPVATLKAAAGLLGRVLAEPRLFAAPRIVLAESARFPQLAELYRREVIDVALPALTGLISQAMADGVFRKADPRVVARSLIGGILMQALWQAVFARADEPGLDPDAFIETHLDIVLNGLCAPEAA